METFIVWRDNDQMVFGKALKYAVGTVGIGAAEANVSQAFGDAVYHLLTVLTLDVEGDIGVFLPKSRDDLGQNVLGRNGRSTDGQCTLELLVVVSYRAAGIIAQIEHLDRVLIQNAAWFGGIDILGAALDQLGIQLFFQRVDVCADGRLGQIDALCCLGKAFELDDIHKRFQLFKIHNATSFP